jgi:TRAP-type C4-dicarboxylate transport system permease large subunit
MTTGLLFVLLMAISLVVLVVVAKWPVSLSLAATSVLILLLAGDGGLHLDKLVEGMFGYLDVGIVLITAMIFMKILEANGMLAELTRVIIVAFGRSPLGLLVALTIVVMFPGMITGSCTASVLGTGAIVAPILVEMGLPLLVAGAFISSAAVYGMIAPPVNVLVMTIGGGIDLPYIGFDLPLALVSFPMAILTSIYLGYRYVEKDKLARVIERSRTSGGQSGGAQYLPLIVVFILMVGPKAFPQWFPDPRLPLTFLIGSALALCTGKRVKPLKAALDGVNEILPVIGILFGVGMLIEVMTLTGIRGAIVVGALSLPDVLMLAGLALILPIFGGVSVYGGASVLGVPFALAMLGKDQIIVLTALSLIGAMGSYMPPVALTPVVTAKMIGEAHYMKIARLCLVPSIAAILVGLLMIVFANPIAHFLGV